MDRTRLRKRWGSIVLAEFAPWRAQCRRARKFYQLWSPDSARLHRRLDCLEPLQVVWNLTTATASKSSTYFSVVQADWQSATSNRAVRAKILDVREKYPDATLADLYDELSMPKDLRQAHRANDRAVAAVYGWESSCNAIKLFMKGKCLRRNASTQEKMNQMQLFKVV